MSEADTDKTPEVKLDGAGGFMPEPAPPRMTAEEAGLTPEEADAAGEAAPAGDAGSTRPEIQLAGVQPDGSVAVPQDTARRALEAVQVLVENNRAASQQLEALMGIVLDAAEVANRSASAVATTGGHVNRAAEKLVDGAQRSAAQAKLVLGIAGAVIVGSAGVFSFMSVQLQNKVAQLDEMMLAVGKRAVDLKRRMESMDEIHAALEDLKLAQQNTQSVQQAIEDRIARMQEAPPAQAKPEPAKTAAAPLSPEAQAARKAEAEAREAAARERTAKAQAENRQLLQQLTTLDAMLKDQAKAVKELSGQFGTLQGAVTSTETLAAQQKLREKEMAQELAAERARREKEVKDKERELVRERERAREREAARERELARERGAVKEKLAAAEREAERQRVVSYRRDQSRPASTPPDAKVPSFTATGGTKSE